MLIEEKKAGWDWWSPTHSPEKRRMDGAQDLWGMWGGRFIHCGSETPVGIVTELFLQHHFLEELLGRWF
jgi:hypothetical protein